MQFKMPWSKPATKAAPPREQKSVTVGLSDVLSQFLLLGTDTLTITPTQSLKTYSQSTAVATPVNMVADAFACIVPILKNTRTREITTDHPVLALLRRPSPWFDGTLLQEFLAKEYLITGETGMVALGNINRPPLELQPISARNFTPSEGRNGYAMQWTISDNSLPGGYDLRMLNKRARYLQGSLREFKHIRNYSTRDNSLLRGQSPLVSAAAEARQHILGNTHNVSLLENGGKVSLVFHFDADMSDDDFEATKERVRQQYGGTSKAGQIGVTAGGQLDIKEVGVNNKDMDFANLQQMVKQAVALHYKVPLPLVTTDASTFDNYTQAKVALYDDAVLPMADRLYAHLSELLLPRFGVDPSEFQISYDIDQITALAKRRTEELAKRKEIGIETVNELRTTTGKEPVEGGDTLYQPASMVPLGQPMLGDSPTGTPPAPTLLRDAPPEDVE